MKTVVKNFLKFLVAGGHDPLDSRGRPVTSVAHRRETVWARFAASVEELEPPTVAIFVGDVVEQRDQVAPGQVGKWRSDEVS